MPTGRQKRQTVSLSLTETSVQQQHDRNNRLKTDPNRSTSIQRLVGQSGGLRFHPTEPQVFRKRYHTESYPTGAAAAAAAAGSVWVCDLTACGARYHRRE